MSKVVRPVGDDLRDASYAEVEPSKVVTKMVQSLPKSRSDQRFVDVSADLPSQFFFYDWDALSIRPLNLLELKKIYRAHILKDFRMLAEALGATLDKDIFALTVGDFWWVMYWQRLNSFNKTPFSVQWRCSDEKHNMAVRLHEKPEATLQNESILSMSTLEKIPMDIDAVNVLVNEVFNDYGLYLYPSTVADMADMADLSKGDAFDEGDAWFMTYASNLGRSYGASLTERILYLQEKAEVDNISPDFIASVDKFIAVSNHGVHETVSLKCKECGALNKTEVSVNALTFFPAVQ